MAGVINQFTQQQSAALEEQKSKYHKYIKRLKRDLADESGVIARQIAQIDAQTNKIKDMQGANEQVTSELRDVEAKLEAAEDRARRLEDKYRACKTHLNSAIQEQQDLYTRSKKQWEEAIEQVRAMEKSRNAETEAAVQKAEVIREQMMEKVCQAIAQNKSEALERKSSSTTPPHVEADSLPSVRKDRCPDTSSGGKGSRAQPRARGCSFLVHQATGSPGDIERIRSARCPGQGDPTKAWRTTDKGRGASPKICKRLSGQVGVIEV
jgi:uncharacterized coiled-coil protein SlyX